MSEFADRAPTVDVAELGFRYGERQALDGVTLQVSRGEIFGFLGPNGGGKTTLFRILATLLPVQSGRAVLLGHDLATEAAKVRRHIGVAFQTPSVDLTLTVEENLHHQGLMYGLTGARLRRQTAALMDRLGLAERRADRVEELSGGLRRRVEIAKALLHGPELLLLDEPSTGLDPKARRDLWRTLDELRRGDGVTVLLTTHFMEEAERSDRLALLDRGRIAAVDTPVALRREIGGNVVTVDAAEPETVRQVLAERFGVEAQLVEGRVRFERDGALELTARLAEAAPGQIQSVTVSQPTLEDVFLHRTGHGLWADGRQET